MLSVGVERALRNSIAKLKNGKVGVI